VNWWKVCCHCAAMLLVPVAVFVPDRHCWLRACAVAVIAVVMGYTGTVAVVIQVFKRQEELSA